MERIAVFGYASLVDPASAAATLGRPAGEIEPATLRGYGRRWSLVRDNLTSEKTFRRIDDGTVPRRVLALNLEPGGEDEIVNGGLVAIGSASELARLDLREIRYERLEVGESVDGECPFDRVYAYRAKPAHTALEPPADAVVLASYLAAVELAFEALGELERYLATTPPPPVEVVEAELIRDRIPPGNPRMW